ncbi:hypothetical protein [Phocaeicola sartorii]|uniref:Uncharacterized protein n=1 Tax=Phocaeicola sartorii TaxID=671267 RepID=A0A4S2FLN2_9BACT|nr:hypothetical protein [Phocaeicola sartorii]TGY69842.1 hypothetical protein E5339_11635 [Phocaeicola sartorii]
MKAHIYTYVRMGLYVRMCGSTQAYAQAYTYVCEFQRDLIAVFQGMSSIYSGLYWEPINH